MRSRRGAGRPTAGWRQSGFTLIELLVVVSIIAVLVAMLIPAIGLLRDRARAAATRDAVMGLEIAMNSYAAEDARHFFPSPAAGDLLLYDETAPVANLVQMETRGYIVAHDRLDKDPASPTSHALLDAWRRPIYYRLDGPFRTAAGVIDSSRMSDGTIARPAPAETDWNPRDVEPWAYIWSLGRPQGDLATDALPAHAASWIFQHGTR